MTINDSLKLVQERCSNSHSTTNATTFGKNRSVTVMPDFKQRAQAKLATSIMQNSVGSSAMGHTPSDMFEIVGVMRAFLQNIMSAKLSVSFCAICPSLSLPGIFTASALHFSSLRRRIVYHKWGNERPNEIYFIMEGKNWKKRQTNNKKKLSNKMVLMTVPTNLV